MNDALRIRPGTAADWDTAMAWAAAEGWNPGLSDGPLFRGLDPGGLVVGTLAGEPAAIVNLAAVEPAHAFLGLYIVRPDLRGRGHGRAVWDAGLARAVGRVVALEGVVAQQAAYRRSGFATVHRTIRFSGPLPAAAGARDPRIAPWDGDAPEPLLRELLAYDARHLPASRPAFARAWLAGPDHAVRVARLDGRIVGYGVARPAREGFRIGPLLADAPDLADALFRALAEACGSGDSGVAIDMPEPNAAGLRLAEGLGLRPVFETARMYRGPAPDLPLASIYGLASLEVG